MGTGRPSLRPRPLFGAKRREGSGGRVRICRRFNFQPKVCLHVITTTPYRGG